LAQTRRAGRETNFEPTEISEAIPIAIKDDWDAEGYDQTVRELRNILELAGALHLDHLAWLKQSPLGEHVPATNFRVLRNAKNFKPGSASESG
jgi:hypothetical protein